MPRANVRGRFRATSVLYQDVPGVELIHPSLVYAYGRMQLTDLLSFRLVRRPSEQDVEVDIQRYRAEEGAPIKPDSDQIVAEDFKQAAAQTCHCIPSGYRELVKAL
jgi:hypothetical protein